MKHIKLFENFSEYIIGQYYKIDVRNYDEDEMIWNYLSPIDYNKYEYKCVYVDVNELYETIEDTIEYMDGDQENTVGYYETIINDLLNDVIIVDNTEIIDGHHRIVAFYNKGVKKCKALDISIERKL